MTTVNAKTNIQINKILNSTKKPILEVKSQKVIYKINQTSNKSKSIIDITEGDLFESSSVFFDIITIDFSISSIKGEISLLKQLKAWARTLKKQIFVLYFAYQDDRVAWYTKLFTACVVAYAFSPIDLIPDFIPIFGYLDDVIIVPLGIMIALKMLPKNVVEDCIVKAEARMKQGKPKNWVVGSLIIMLWLAIFVWVCIIFLK
jgi:uncharacterized membrane protein YkvA (DUF1232 family)